MCRQDKKQWSQPMGSVDELYKVGMLGFHPQGFGLNRSEVKPEHWEF